MTPSILRDSPDAKWRLLELVLQAETHAGKPREQWPEIILIGDAFAPGTLAAARALAGAYEVQIRFAESLSGAPRFHEAPDLSAMGHFFSRGGLPHRRIFFTGGHLRWSARARRRFAYVRQSGRFPDDFDFWRKRLSDPNSVRPSTRENRIQFRLHTQQDFDRFEEAVRQLETANWTGLAADPDEDAG
ncbi:MAG TPA: hypothetical protein VFQ79_05970 [Bryobacteraceae bacterium]|nr:hypothetical protein [Bryobacteraceae bacterium]